MLSGAFILDDARTRDYHFFYKSRFRKILVPTIIFSILYVLYRIPFCFIGEDTGIQELLAVLKDIIIGAPNYHMWYMYMLLILYLLAPWAIRVKDEMSESTFFKFSFVFLVLASLSRWTSTVKLNWDLGQAFEYLGYFFVGYALRNRLSTGEKLASHGSYDNRSNQSNQYNQYNNSTQSNDSNQHVDSNHNTHINHRNIKGLLLILSGLLVEIGTAFIEYHYQIILGIPEGELKYAIVLPYSPTIVLASVLIFTGFSIMSIKEHRIIKRLAGMSFIIYLFHAGVWDFMYKVIYFITGDYNFVLMLDPIYWIPLMVATVFVISVVLTIVYEKWAGHLLH